MITEIARALTEAEEDAIDVRRAVHIQALAAVGVIVACTTGLDDLQSTSELVEGYPRLAPTLDKGRVGFGDQDAFSLILYHEGRIVGTFGAVRREVRASLRDSLADLSLLYDADTLAAGDLDAWCRCDDDLADSIRGVFAFCGAIWRAESVKGLLDGGFARHLAALGGLQVYEQWRPDWVGSLQLTKDREWLTKRLYRYQTVLEGVRYCDSRYPTTGYGMTPLDMGVMGRDEIRERLLGLESRAVA